jgi:hypothetical protein
MKSSLPVAGFAIIEAANLAEAMEMVSRSPCAVAHGVVEVWPLEWRNEFGASDRRQESGTSSRTNVAMGGDGE